MYHTPCRHVQADEKQAAWWRPVYSSMQSYFAMASYDMAPAPGAVNVQVGGSEYACLAGGVVQPCCAAGDAADL